MNAICNLSGEYNMRGKFLAGVLLVLTMLLIGCGKKTEFKPADDSTIEEPTDTPMPEPTPQPITEEYAGRISYVYGNSMVWDVPGKLHFEAIERGTGKDGDWSIPALLLGYEAESTAGEELFRITTEQSTEGVSFTLRIGTMEGLLLTIPAGEAWDFTLYHDGNRYTFVQNGFTLLSIAADAEFMTVMVGSEQNVTAYRYPVRQFAVRPLPQGNIVSAERSRLLPTLQTLTDIYDGKYLGSIVDSVRKNAREEWPADYVQITKERINANGGWTEYNVIYKANTVVVDRTDSSAPSTITEYAFNELSEGIPNVEYYIYEGLSEKLLYTFDGAALDRYRLAIYEEESAELRRMESIGLGKIPLLLEWTDFGFVERGIVEASEEEQEYVRFHYADGTVYGDVWAVYADGTRPVTVYIDRLGAKDCFYADGRIIPGTYPNRELVRRSYDKYGVLTEETNAAGVIRYSYTFSDFAYGGADDTIRHEWQKLMPYLEKADKKPAEEPDDGENEIHEEFLSE